MTQPDFFETWRTGFGPIVHSDETIERVRALVGAMTQARLFGLIGEPRVNVLRLNLALDQLHSS